jgi:glycosyltransferase involved in cell wall biosynthesis
MVEPPLLVIEPTYRGSDHAPVNAGILDAIAAALPARPVVFASTPEQRAAVMAVLAGPPPAHRPIEVPPPGRASLARLRAQLRALRGAVADTAARTAVLLSSGPETFFAAGLLAALDRGLRLFIVLHGNATALAGWRSRDPRHRLLDYRSGFRVAQRPNIRMVVLEPHIGEAVAARSRRLHHPCLVWPHPVATRDFAPPCARAAPVPPVRVAFLGATSAEKGFDTFLRLADAVPRTGVRLEVIGHRYGPVAERCPDWLVPADRPLPREEYLRRLRAVDYVCLPLRREVYELTASGSLLDCIANLVPVIATRSRAIERLEREHGAIGFIGDDEAQLRSLLCEPGRLADPTAYAGFREALRRVRDARLPASLARRLRDDLGG